MDTVDGNNNGMCTGKGHDNFTVSSTFWSFSQAICCRHITISHPTHSSFIHPPRMYVLFMFYNNSHTNHQSWHVEYSQLVVIVFIDHCVKKKLNIAQCKTRK